MVQGSVGAWLCISLYDAGKWGRGCVQSGSVSHARSMGVWLCLLSLDLFHDTTKLGVWLCTIGSDLFHDAWKCGGVAVYNKLCSV